MNSPSIACELSSLFAGARKGDQQARNELFTILYERIQRLTAVMLRTFPVVRQRREVVSVTNDLVAKLLQMLEDPNIQLAGEADLFRIAAHKLRLLLIDEAEKYRRRNALLARREHGEIAPDSSVPGPVALGFDPAGNDSLDPAALAEWTEFHAKIAELPDDERTVVELHLLMGLKQAEIAPILGWEPKQVSRTWLAASLKLADYLPSIR